LFPISTNNISLSYDPPSINFNLGLTSILINHISINIITPQIFSQIYQSSFVKTCFVVIHYNVYGLRNIMNSWENVQMMIKCWNIFTSNDKCPWFTLIHIYMNNASITSHHNIESGSLYTNNEVIFLNLWWWNDNVNKEVIIIYYMTFLKL